MSDHITKDIIKWGAMFVLLTVFVFIFNKATFFLITASFFSIFALSWAYFTSFSGYLNLGHVIFIGVAGYTSAMFNYHLDFPLFLSIPIGIVTGTVLGWLYFYYIHKKISGLSFEMVTFLSIIALTNLVLSSYARPLTGADLGLSPLDTIFTSQNFAVILAAILCITGFVYTRFLKSKSGRVIDFAREQQDLVKTAGANPHHYTGKLLLLSGFVGAVGGALYVHYSGAAVISNTLQLSFMISIVIMAIVGGRFSLYGPILGAYAIIFLGVYLKRHVSAHIENMIIYGIGFMIYFLKPQGLISLVEIAVNRAINTFRPVFVKTKGINR